MGTVFFDMDWSVSEASNRFGTMLIVFGVLDYIILHVFSKFHFFCRMQIFHLEWSLKEASDRFGTMPIVSAILENIILLVFRLSTPTRAYN